MRSKNALCTLRLVDGYFSNWNLREMAEEFLRTHFLDDAGEDRDDPGQLNLR